MSLRFRVVVALMLAMAMAMAGALVTMTALSASALVSAYGGFTSVPPTRLLDTRLGLGASKAAVPGGGTVHLQVTGHGDVPSAGVSAVVMNVTVTAPTSSGYLIVYGDDSARPGVSNLNFVAHQTAANLVVAQVGTNGKVALYNGSAGTVQLIADVCGYYLAGVARVEGGFGSLSPTRLLDTRIGLGAAKSAVLAGAAVHLQVAGGAVPSVGVSAVVLNVTVTAPTRPGVITASGDGTTRLTTSNLNFLAGQTVPNLVITPVGTNGKVVLYNRSAGTVQLIADVCGYYLGGVPDVEGAFGSLTPTRLLDTRIGLGAAKSAVSAGAVVHLQVTRHGAVPSAGVSAVVLNVTVTAPSSGGYLTVYGDGRARPGVSSLNFVPAQTAANLVVAPVGTNGKVALYNGSAGTVQLIADISGYYRSEAGPSPGTYSGSGFDTCAAPPSEVMAAWLGTSPYKAIGIYIGGDNRTCAQPELTPSWVSTQQNAGWHLVPIYLGPQPYCTNSAKKDRFTAPDAAASGQAAADDAIVQARVLGLATGSTIFNDVEDYSTTDSQCRTAVLTYQSAWTAQLHASGFLSGFYSSLGSGIKDQVTVYNSTAYVRPDYLWFARYDTVATVSDPVIPSTYWLHRRIKQYQSPIQSGTSETYGGQPLLVDRDQCELGP
jgi:hypothetical protein